MQYYHNHSLRRWEAALLMALGLSLALGLWAQETQAAMAGKLLRLHVVAVSDAPEEQALKLRVRDAVLAYLAPAMDQAENAQEARDLIASDLAGLARAAAAASEGRSVQVSLAREDFPARDYGAFCLPAGPYEALRVVLGEGQGHNWWCVVYPPLCLSAAGEEEMAAVMSREELGLMTRQESYELRFRLLELWGELRSAACRSRR